ncbi:hypothetical protein ACFX2A_014024 [Malus domestica]
MPVCRVGWRVDGRRIGTNFALCSRKFPCLRRSITFLTWGLRVTSLSDGLVSVNGGVKNYSSTGVLYLVPSVVPALVSLLTDPFFWDP